ncbi:Hypothetical predicted protein [Cloeon dipterum]|uniref:Cationic amino acid transporter C-terminal domain-containing protein n=1 Tax=Cloeon dipterum TaxID=197152 RepID=A0A8S1CLY6_9INSE|nr:Hypothetical predicted protein [Cloeon dipterum]
MKICKKLFRPRAPTTIEPAEKGLRGLYLVDLISDSIGGPLGLGVFVLLGYVARTAGPAVVLAVTFAAIVAGIAGACYAELGSTCRKTGATAAFALNLAGAGELVAFLVTWNLIADLAIGAAAAARSIRATIDVVSNNTLSGYFDEVASLDSEFTANYVDFLALVIPIVATIACSVFREYMLPRVAGTLFSLVMFLYMIFGGAFVADNSNWYISPICNEPSVCDGRGDGYFLPFGITSVFQGACILIVSFIDLGKGAYPRRSLLSNKESLPPISVLTGYITGFVFLFFVGLIVTMMKGYDLLETVPEVVDVFNEIPYHEGIWIVAVGAIMILSFTVETFAYTIAGELNTLSNEGAIFQFLGNVDIFGKRRPFYGVLTIGISSGLIGAFFSEAQLAQMISIGTVVSFGLIMSVSIIKRCEYNAHVGEKTSIGSVVKQFLMCKKLDGPTQATSYAAKIATIFYSIVCLGIGGLVAHFPAEIGLGSVWAVVTLIVLSVLALYTLVVIELQPTRKNTSAFQVPFFPFFQALGILFTSFLIMNMHVWAWYRLAAWSAFGLLVYMINWCVQPDRSVRPKGKSGSNSDVSAAALVASKSSISTKSKTSDQDAELNETIVREQQWKPEDLRRNGWLPTGESDISIGLIDIDTQSFASESVKTQDETSAIVEVTLPEIVVSEMLQGTADSTPTLSRHEDTPEFYARQLDDMFTFDVPADTDSHCGSSMAGDSVIEVHAVPGSPASPRVDQDTGESPPDAETGESPAEPSEARSVHFETAASMSSDDEMIENNSELLQAEDEVVVAPSSPRPPPLPPATVLISTHLTARSRSIVEPLAHVVPEPPEVEENENTSHLNDFQLELRNTLKMRNQKMIDGIDNQVLNVNEGIEIFGGRRSRNTSISQPPGEDAEVPVMKAGKFENHAFVEKLDSILKDQMSGADKRGPRAKVYKQKRVVLQELANSKQDVPIKLSSAELLSAKSKLRTSTGESSSLAGDLNSRNSRKVRISEPVIVASKVTKSLEALSTNVVIIE